MTKQTTTPNKISSLLQAGELLPHLGRMLSKQQTLLKAVRSHLPSPLDQHCLHTRISGKELIIHTDSPVWNARLRFHGPQLIRAMRRQAPHLQQLKINTHIDTSHQVKRRQAMLSANSTAHILAVADTVADPELQAALRRLGNSARQDAYPAPEETADSMTGK